jgi:hypothetical protein
MSNIRPPISRYTVSFTGADANAEAIISGVPEKGYITRIHAVKTAGSAAHIQPVVGTATNPEGTLAQILLVAASSGIHIDEVPTEPIPFSSGSKLFIRPKPDAAADNAISIELFIEPAI